MLIAHMLSRPLFEVHRNGLVRKNLLTLSTCRQNVCKTSTLLGRDQVVYQLSTRPVSFSSTGRLIGTSSHELIASSSPIIYTKSSNRYYIDPIRRISLEASLRPHLLSTTNSSISARQHLTLNPLLLSINHTTHTSFSSTNKKHLSIMTIDSILKKLEKRELVVFDFDDTLVDCNSDTWIHQLAPGRSIPNDLLYQVGQDYFKHVQTVLNYLHSVKVTKQDYVSCLSKMPQVPGMIDTLVKGLGQYKDKYDMIILSDANSFFITTYLESQSISDLFSTILTNPSKFNDNGQLIVNEYHIQDYCPISSRNLCKGEALKNFIAKRMLEQNVVYTCINYVGDGENDLCPSTKLSLNDRIFPRKDFSLDRLCSKHEIDLSYESYLPEGQFETIKKVVANLKAPVIPWVVGKDILEIILNKGASSNNINT